MADNLQIPVINKDASDFADQNFKNDLMKIGDENNTD